MQTWSALRGVWTAPQPKAVPPPPPVHPPPSPQLINIPPPPPPPGLSGPVRSEKRRKLQDFTTQLINEPWRLDDELLSKQEECFHDYETHIESLNSKLNHRDTCIYEQKQNINSITKQLCQKNSMLRKRNSDISILRASNVSLQTQIESVSLRAATEASQHDENVNHYKSLIKGLQKTAENAEESAMYLRHMKKLIHEYENGETLEDCLRTSDRKCSICMAEHANVVCMPCSHMEFCMGCAIATHSLASDCFSFRKSVELEAKCPRCKGQVNELMYVFT